MAIDAADAIRVCTYLARMGYAAQRRAERFRFLRPEEVRKLSRKKRAEYLRRAIEAVRNGHPLNDLPVDYLH